MSANKTVLITGSSSGIGFELAKIFAANTYNLVLVARDKEKLLQSGKELQREGIEIYCMVKDLSDAKAPAKLYNELHHKGIKIDVLVNNAGFATYGLFTEIELEKELEELQVNIVTLTHLTKLFVRNMVKRKEGKILNVASTAAFLPGPLMAVYYASKAYVLSFSEALANELMGTGVSLSVLCPGPTDTGFVKKAHLESSKLFSGENMKASLVAQIAYEGLMNNKTLIVPGIKNRIGVEISRFVPPSLAAKVARSLQEKKR
ncbi:MAG: SDR family oxidoreductase [Patescibacteria group bacterium]